MSARYDDLLNLPCPTSKAHERMPRGARAAQFAPFAALTGFEGVLKETARLTDARAEPDDAARAKLNEQLNLLLKHVKEHPPLRVTRFVRDARKEGGAYQTLEGFLKGIDPAAGILRLTSGDSIPFSDILEIESELFPDLPPV